MLKNTYIKEYPSKKEKLSRSVSTYLRSAKVCSACGTF